MKSMPKWLSLTEGETKKPVVFEFEWQHTKKWTQRQTSMIQAIIMLTQIASSLLSFYSNPLVNFLLVKIHMISIVRKLHWTNSPFLVIKNIKRKQFVFAPFIKMTPLLRYHHFDINNWQCCCSIAFVYDAECPY